jgi:hypothetical protein
MPEAEMHALEKAAMEDMFLADALEGYVNTATPDKDLAEIRERLSEKGGGKVIPIKRSYTWIRIAALVVVILGIGYMSYYFNSPKQNAIVAANDTTKVERKMEAAKATDSTQEAFLNKAPVTANQYEYKTDRSPIKDKEKNINPQSRHATEADSVSTITNVNKSAEVKEDQNEVTFSPSQKQNILTGKVVDTKGKPVPNASITNNNITTTTDNSGQFNLKTNDSTPTLNIAATGYNSKDTKLNNGETVVLEESGKGKQSDQAVTALQTKREKKAMGYSTSKTQAAPDSVSEPVVGWQKFNKYIKDNIDVRAKEKGENYIGTVILSFEINKKGSPIKIKVEQSLNNSLDEEAIRLLRDGPKWKYVKEKRCKVSIQF